MTDVIDIEELSANRSFEGWNKQYRHTSSSLNCDMRFGIYLPPQTSNNTVPVLYWLSGLTCTDENFMQKSGVQRIAAELGIAIVAPDTSPRGDNVPDDPDNAYDFGLGAGFYLNATQAPWNTHYHMYDYVLDELPKVIEKHFPVNNKRSISGHSMGGHGALVLGMRNPEKYSSISAFSPICNPSDCGWGKKAFTGYLGDDQKAWEQYDASILMQASQSRTPILVDQGLDDNFLSQQLKPGMLELSAKAKNYPLTLQQHEGYDHSYFFIASFIEQHLRFHWKHLNP